MDSSEGDRGKTPSVHGILSEAEGRCGKTPSLHSILSEKEARRAE